MVCVLCEGEILWVCVLCEGGILWVCEGVILWVCVLCEGGRLRGKVNCVRVRYCGCVYCVGVGVQSVTLCRGSDTVGVCIM